jgi:hypothetical protein
MAMKSIRIIITAGLLLLALPAALRADRVDELKAEIAASLPEGSHQDRVQQFLKVRKIKTKPVPKERSLIAYVMAEKKKADGTELVAVFQFDENDKLIAVSYRDPKQEPEGVRSKTSTSRG